jgi:hypothetical protein
LQQFSLSSVEELSIVLMEQMHFLIENCQESRTGNLHQILRQQAHILSWEEKKGGMVLTRKLANLMAMESLCATSTSQTMDAPTNTAILMSIHIKIILLVVHASEVLIAPCRRIKDEYL